MNTFWKKNKLYLIGGVLGAIGGYLYYTQVGCVSGSCPITSSALLSTLWGAVMGGLLLSLFQKREKKNE